MIRKEEVFRIGRLGKPHGVDGEISFSFTDDVFDRTESPYWVMEIDGILVPFFLESYRFRGETSALVKFLDMDNSEDVRMLADHDVFYPCSYASAEQHQKAELTWRHFIGFAVELSDSHQKLGTIDDVDDSTMNVLFKIGKWGRSYFPSFALKCGKWGRSYFPSFALKCGESRTVPISLADELIIPANEDFIDEVDLEGRRLVMHLPEGLLNLDSQEVCE